MGNDAVMTDEMAPITYDVRALHPDELRAASTLFRAALHYGPASDEEWAAGRAGLNDDRVLGAFRDGTMVGTALSFGSELLLPGGESLPMAMVTAVGVRADSTRRGALTALMRAQLTGVREPLATLRASEATIYGRFGYGVATRGRTVLVNGERARFRPGVPGGGSVRIMPLGEAFDLLPALYDSIGDRRPGWIARPEAWWREMRSWVLRPDGGPHVVAVHTGPDGDDGFVMYQVPRGSRGERRAVTVSALTAAGPDAWAGLWRFLLSIDLAEDVRAGLRPLDEPVEELFDDVRAVRTVDHEDETWLRLVDVPRALAGRAFGTFPAASGSVVIEVRDAFLPANSGRYRLGDGPAVRVVEPAELTMDVDVLAQLFLGDVAPSTLAYAGRLTAAKSDALSAADRLFAVDGSPWCGTYF